MSLVSSIRHYIKEEEAPGSATVTTKVMVALDKGIVWAPVGYNLRNQRFAKIQKREDNSVIAPHLSGNRENSWVLQNALADKILSILFASEPEPYLIL